MYLSDIVEVIQGQAVKNDMLHDSGEFEYLQPKEINDINELLPSGKAWLSNLTWKHPNFVSAGDILLRCNGRVFPAVRVVHEDPSAKFIFHLHFLHLKLKVSENIVVPQFLQLLLNTQRMQETLLRMASGSTMLYLRKPNVLQLPVSIPPLDIQLSLIREFDEMIEFRKAAEKMIEAKSEALKVRFEEALVGLS